MKGDRMFQTSVHHPHLAWDLLCTVYGALFLAVVKHGQSLLICSYTEYCVEVRMQTAAWIT